MSENFEHKVKKMLEGVQFEPGDDVWPQVRQAIEPGRRRRRFVFWWILPLALAGGFGIYLLNRSSEHPAAVAEGKLQTPETIKQNIGEGENNERENTTTISPVAPAKPGKPVIEKQARNQSLAKLEKQTPQAHRNITPQRTNHKAAGGQAPVSLKENTGDPSQVQELPVIADSMAIALAPGETTSNTALVAPGHPPAAEKWTTAVDSTATAPVVTVKRNRKWKLGVSAELGIARLADGLGGPVKESLTATPSSGSGFSSMVYKRRRYEGNLLWGGGLVAERQLNNKLVFQGGLGYQYRSFSVNNNAYKDSLVAGTLTTFPVFTEMENYRFHSLNLSAGVLFRLWKQKDFGLSAGAGLDNQLMVAAQTEKESYAPGSQVFVQEKRSVMEGYHRWQPQLKLQLQAGFNTARQQSLQFTPYLRYGFRGLENQPAKERKHLLSYGLGINYFFR